jgi:hypothetical protein
VQPLVFKVVSKARFTFRYVRPFDDLAGSGDEPTAKFHADA